MDDQHDSHIIDLDGRRRPWRTKRELAAALGVSLRTIERRSARGEVERRILQDGTHVYRVADDSSTSVSAEGVGAPTVRRVGPPTPVATPTCRDTDTDSRPPGTSAAASARASSTPPTPVVPPTAAPPTGVGAPTVERVGGPTPTIEHQAAALVELAESSRVWRTRCTELEACVRELEGRLEAVADVRAEATSPATADGRTGASGGIGVYLDDEVAEDLAVALERTWARMEAAEARAERLFAANGRYEIQLAKLRE